MILLKVVHYMYMYIYVYMYMYMYIYMYMYMYIYVYMYMYIYVYVYMYLAYFGAIVCSVVSDAICCSLVGTLVSMLFRFHM